jgi:cytoskeleton protein RodZ
MTDVLEPSTGWQFVPADGDATDQVDTAERPAVDRREPADEPEPGEVVVRRNGRISAVVAAVAALMSAAYFARAATTGGTLDWLICAVMLVLTWAYVFSFLDSRLPLLVADSHGIRIRLGRTWRGMAWGDLDEVEHLPRRQLRDGRLVLFPRDVDQELALLGRSGQRHARASQRLFGAPFALPLGLTTRVVGARRDLTGALAALSNGRCGIVEVVRDAPAPSTDATAGPAADSTADDAAEATPVPTYDEVYVSLEDTAPFDPSSLRDEPEAGTQADTETEDTVVVASPTPSPLREVSTAARVDVAIEPPTQPAIPAIPSATSTFLMPELADVPLVDPVIGPELRTARERLRLSVDQLAERTRIRPHVIEAIEIDDFAPCGGDFYARGHLRTLARVLGVDVAPLLATYDEKYGDAPIDPRRVFEAELSTGRHGAIRGVRGGPNWSVIVTAVMVVVLAWSVARLVVDSPGAPEPSSPTLADGSAGLTSGSSKAATPVPVVVAAAGGGARVVVRDGTGKVVFTGSLAFGQSRTLQVAPPVRVQSTDGSLEVTVDGVDKGALGKTGSPAQDVFTAR